MPTFLKYRKLLIIIASVLTLLVLIWVGGCLYIVNAAPKLTFDTAKSKNNDYGITKGYGQTFIKNSVGEKVEVLIIPKPESTNITVYFHGNIGRLGKIMREAGEVSTVISPAYPGYSESEGTATADKVYETVDLTMKYLFDQKYTQNQITVLGHSLGGSSAVYAATKYPNLKKVVLVNTFYSVQAMCEKQYSILCAFSGEFMNTAKIARDAKAKIVHFHNEKDEFIPHEQGVRLHKILGGGNKDKPLLNISGSHREFPVKDALTREE